MVYCRFYVFMEHSLIIIFVVNGSLKRFRWPLFTEKKLEIKARVEITSGYRKFLPCQAKYPVSKTNKTSKTSTC